LKERKKEYSESIDVKIAVGTWNVNGGKNASQIFGDSVMPVPLSESSLCSWRVSHLHPQLAFSTAATQHD
jgi:hypothetical protein